jgi:hypothetical protein
MQNFPLFAEQRGGAGGEFMWTKAKVKVYRSKKNKNL